MPRPQFTLRALLVAMLVVGAFFGGMEWQRRAMRPVIFWERKAGDERVGEYLRIDTLVLPDGTRWFRPVYGGTARRSITFSEGGTKVSVEVPDRPSAP